jgi:RNA polymerase sigma factor (sigma-70 family)
MTTVQELVEKTKRGDSAASGELWLRCEPQVRALCRRYLVGPHRDPAVDEDDLAMEAFVRAFCRMDCYEDRSGEGVGFEAWLLEVTKRICLKFLAKRRRRQQWSALMDEEEDLVEQPDFRPSVEQVVVERELLRLVAIEISVLPDHYRIPLWLSLEQHSQPAIAAALGISGAAAAKRVQRARQRLQPRLAGLFEL